MPTHNLALKPAVIPDQAIVEQIYTGCLSQAAYYLECAGEAAVIDPLRDPQPYIDRAARSGAKIRWIFETHFHADFVSGHLELQRLTGATIVYGPHAKPAFVAHIAKDGEEFPLGGNRLRLLHTPGHTVESSCYLWLSGKSEILAVFTGDTLFLGDVGRPDLAVQSDRSKEDLAAMLYESLHSKLMILPDATVVYPGHGAGSACGKNLAKETMDTLGHQRETNYALRSKDKASFIREVLAGISPAPAYFPENARLNREGYGQVSVALREGLQPLSPHEFEAAANQSGALILDTRPAALFCQGFIPRSIHIGLDGQFASWTGALIGSLKQPILFIAEPGREKETVTRLTRIGYDHPIGYLQGGIPAWVAAGKQVDFLDNLPPAGLAKYLNTHPDTRILDVRNPLEFAAGHLAAAENLPLEEINERMHGLSRHSRYLVHCAGGYRSMIAASILKSRGFEDVANIAGGFNALREIPL